MRSFFYCKRWMKLVLCVGTFFAATNTTWAIPSYDSGVSGSVSEVTLGNFRSDLTVDGRILGSHPDANGDSLDGSRVYIYDYLDTTFSSYAMLVFEMDSAYDSMRLYTHQDHYSGGPITTDFVAQDVMEYSVWGSNSVSDPASLSDWTLLSDVIGYDIAGEGIGLPTYTFAGTEPTTIFRGGSLENGTTNAYTREYTFSEAYEWYGIRSSTISILAGDADPEIDAIGGFNAAPVPEPSTLFLLGAGLVGLVFYRMKSIC